MWYNGDDKPFEEVFRDIDWLLQRRRADIERHRRTNRITKPCSKIWSSGVVLVQEVIARYLLIQSRSRREKSTSKSCVLCTKIEARNGPEAPAVTRENFRITLLIMWEVLSKLHTMIPWPVFVSRKLWKGRHDGYCGRCPLIPAKQEWLPPWCYS